MKDLKSDGDWPDPGGPEDRATRRAGWSKAALHCNLRDIAIFVAAHEERSFTAAAQRENATQSGVSQHMRNLEQFLGVQLFLRERDGVVPTPAAAVFYRHCLKLLHAHAVARAEMARFADGPSGVVHLGLPGWIAPRILSPTLRRLMAEAPNAAIRVTEGSDAALRQMVRGGEVDMAVVPASGQAPGLRCRPFLRTQEMLVTGTALPGLAPGDGVRLADLGSLKLVLPGPGDSRRHAIEDYCRSQGSEIERAIDLDSLAGGLDFVAGTEWMTILPALMLPSAGQGPAIHAYPVVAPPLPLDLMVIEPARRPLSDLGERVIALLAEEAARLAEPAALRSEGGLAAQPGTLAAAAAAARPGSRPALASGG